MKESIEDPIDWNKGFFLHGADGPLEQQWLFIYGLHDIHVHSLSKKRLLYKLNGIGKKDNSMTVALYVKEYKYVVSGYNSGTLKTWKLSN